MKKGFDNLSDLVNQGLKRVGVHQSVREKTALILWNEVVGHKIASVTRAERVIEGVIFVTCKDNVWAQELHFLRNVMIRKLNEKLGSDIIKDIRLSGVGFKKQAVQEEVPGQKAKEENEPALTDADNEEIKAAATFVLDEDLAQRVARGIKASRALLKKKHN